MCVISDNVIVVIGDNASGKTRYLKELAESFRSKGFIVISNLDNGALKKMQLREILYLKNAQII